MSEILIGILLLLILAAVLWLGFRVSGLVRRQDELPVLVAQIMEEKHRAMLSDLHEGLARQGDRLNSAAAENAERLRSSISLELQLSREALEKLQLSQSENLAQTREAMLTQQAEQVRANQELIQSTLRNTTQQLTTAIESLTRSVDGRLEQISGKVSERLDEGFKKTNETFANVMARLATIDEAQKKIDGLTTNMVSLQELLGDKRSRGAFGEVQLEALIRNILPPSAYAFQYTLSNGSRADCMLKLPEPTGNVAVDSKFPLENYHRMFAPALSEAERAAAQRLFKADVKRHIDAISEKYIIPPETSDGAVMFVPAEAVFAEIHGHHQDDVVDYAMQKRVWIVSPTTMMAILNTARAVIKDVETRKQVHIIKEELGKLGQEFSRFDKRMKNLADHIRQAQKDVDEVHVTSQKISRRFAQIERVQLDESGLPVLEVLDEMPAGSDDS
ncbi:MAG: DNA recombination protein RmuC [Gammaproteobacteria bacterium]|nr:DNA recombination protein RmuC [Gammaproteobacteria bacterium]